MTLTSQDKTLHFNADEQAQLMAIARQDFEIFFSFVGPVLDPTLRLYDMHREIVANLEDWRKNKKKGVVISTPPQHGKSTVAVTYALWLASIGREQVGFITYAESLSIKHMEKVRDIVNSKVYKAIFPNIGIKKAKDTKQEFGLTNGSNFLALGRDSGISGNPFTLIIIDDIVKNFSEALSSVVQEAIKTALSTIMQRIKNNTRIFAIGTRYYEQDATGVFHEEADSDPENWVRMSYPAIAPKDLISSRTGKIWRKEGDALCPEISNLATLSFLKRKLSDSEWFSAYQQAPLRSASFFKPEWFRYAPVSIYTEKKMRAFLTIDPAVTVKAASDDTGFCIAFVDNDGFIYLKAWGEKLQGDELMKKIFDLHLQFGFEKIGIEKMLASQAIQPFLHAESRKRNIPIPIEMLSHGNTAKESRILGALPALYGSGTIYHIGETCKQLEEQILNFPNPRFKDDVLDATAYMAELLKKRRDFSSSVTIGNNSYLGVGDTDIQDRMAEGKKDYERWLRGDDDLYEEVVSY